jgi:DNA-binding MarR family transcriptional regulator/RimJ/RimL family protein N-acetyltransferase
MDLIKQLGEMAIGSRLKRLTMRMNKDVSHIYEELGIDFKARWFPIARLLHLKSPLSITEIADSLNYTHTAIKKFANEMARKGLLDSKQDKNDKRRRLIWLSRKGKKVINSLLPVWKEIHAVTKDLVSSSDPNIIAAIESMEHQLDKKEVYDRIHIRIKPLMLNQIEILDYTPAYKKYFMSINREWLDKYLKTEAGDLKLLSDPKGEIIKPGGAVIFARLKGNIVGTAALMRHSDKFELAKMGVTESARGRMVGTKMTTAIIDLAREAGAKDLYLETHPTFKPAIAMYKKLGFRQIKKSPFPKTLERESIHFKLKL